MLGSGMGVTFLLWLWLVIAVACYTLNRTAKAANKKTTPANPDFEAQLMLLAEA